MTGISGQSRRSLLSEKQVMARSQLSKDVQRVQAGVFFGRQLDMGTPKS
jgi:hypothetical protein